MRLITYLLLTLVASITVHAEVSKSATDGFIIEHKTTVTHDIATVFATMTDKVGDWWNPEHTYSGISNNLKIDKACFCERWDGNLVHHLDLAIWMENSKVVFEGGLGPLKDFGLDGTMIWSLDTDEDGGTTIHWKYYVNGFTDTDLAAFAPVVDSVLAEQFKRLKANLESTS